MWTNIWASIEKAFVLMGEGSQLMSEIVSTTMLMSLQSSVYSLLLGVPIGLLIALNEFPGKKAVVTVIRTLMGLPAVAVGIFVYMLFSGTGPFGKLGLMYSVPLMIIAQVILITPVVAGMTETALSPIVNSMKETTAGLGIKRGKTMLLAVNEGKFQFIAIYLFAFSRSIAEVGAVQIVGGNILHKTRVMTTSIALNYNTGDFQLALALGFILVMIVLAVNVVATLLQTGLKRCK